MVGDSQNRRMPAIVSDYFFAPALAFGDLVAFLAGLALVDLAGFLAVFLVFAAIIHHSFGLTPGAVSLAKGCFSVAPVREKQLKNATLRRGVRTRGFPTDFLRSAEFLGAFADSVKRKS